MSLCCPQCHAGKAALEAREAYLSEGERVRIVRCLLCGWEKSWQAPGPQVANPHRPQDAATPVLLAPVDSPAQVRTRAPRMVNVSSKRKLKYKPCTKVGCTRTYYPAKSVLQLCSVCGHIQQSWLNRSRAGTAKNPAPFIRLEDGSWIDNPARTAAPEPIPVALPEPVAKPAPKHHCRNGRPNVRKGQSPYRAAFEAPQLSAEARALHAEIDRLAACGSATFRKLKGLLDERSPA